jgi:hypothetical protein
MVLICLIRCMFCWARRIASIFGVAAWVAGAIEADGATDAEADGAGVGVGSANVCLTRAIIIRAASLFMDLYFCFQDGFKLLRLLNSRRKLGR